MRIQTLKVIHMIARRKDSYTFAFLSLKNQFETLKRTRDA